MENFIENLPSYAAAYGMKILFAIVVFIIGRWVAKIISGLLEKTLSNSKTEPSLIAFLSKLVYMLLMTVVIIAALGQLGVKTTSFIAILGAAGLAVGMALQGSLANFAAGVMILLFKPFKVGNFISAGGESGTVEEISIFNTILNTPDNKKVIIPNAQVTSGSITNFSANDTRRVDLVVGVSYEDDLQKAKKVLQDVVAADSRVLKDPATVIAVSELADSSVNFVVRPWVNASDYWGVYFDLTEKIKLELDANNISIPYPQQDLHIKSTVSGASQEALTN